MAENSNLTVAPTSNTKAQILETTREKQPPKFNFDASLGKMSPMQKHNIVQYVDTLTDLIVLSNMSYMERLIAINIIKKRIETGDSKFLPEQLQNM